MALTVRHRDGGGHDDVQDQGAIRFLSAALLAALTMTVLAAPVAQAADPSPCWVRNVTRDTHGRSFAAMVAATVDGDRLTVRGTCAGGLVITKISIIRGVGEGRPVLTGYGRVRVLRIGPGATVSMRHLVITRGAGRGGISNHGTLRLTDAVVRDNDGSGISNFGTMRLESSVVRRNTGDWGGGIHNEMGQLKLFDSRVTDNSAIFGGGGIFNMLFGRVVLVNTVVTRNQAEGDGAPRYKGGGINNWTGDDGGGVVVLRRKSSVTGNVPDDCVGTAAC